MTGVGNDDKDDDDDDDDDPSNSAVDFLYRCGCDLTPVFFGSRFVLAYKDLGGLVIVYTKMSFLFPSWKFYDP